MSKSVLYSTFLASVLTVLFISVEPAHALIGQNTCTNNLTSSKTIPTGYGASYNLFSTAKELLISSTCSNNTTTVTVGNDNASTYVYNKGYSWTGSSWKEHTLSCTGQLISSVWCVGKATASVPLTSNPTNVVGYTCQWSGTKWNCGCRDSTCSTPRWQLQQVGFTNTTPSSPKGVKWHPGHYAAVYYGYNWAKTNTVSQVKAFLDSIQNDDYVVGIQVTGQWSSFEGATAGDYSAGFAMMDEILAHAALRGKRVMLRIMAIQYGGYSPSDVSPNHFPAYLVSPVNGGTDSAGNYGITNFNISANQSGITLRTWETATMNRLIALTQAYGDRYNNNPYFEAIQCTCESAVPILQGTDGYTASAYITQLKRWSVAARQAWPNTSIRSQTNFFRNRDESVDFMAAMAQSAIGQSQPDTVPHSASYFDEVYVGKYGRIDYRGVIPYFAELQSPELCNGKDSKPGADAANNYTPQEFYDFVMTDGNEHLGDKPIRPTHFVWEVHTGWQCQVGNQTWDGIGGHRAFIATNPRLVTTCPSTYPSCNTD
jgi:hypothetical protein